VVICLWSVPVEGMKSEEKSVKQSPTSQIQGKSLVIKPVSELAQRRLIAVNAAWEEIAAREAA